jgi:hypothetical protein
MPGGTARSSDAEHAAIRRAASDSGIGLTKLAPREPWAGNEIEKRTLSFQMSEAHSPDWLLVIDADERIIRAPADLKDRLAATECDYADVMSLEQQAPVVHSMAEGAEWPQIHFSHHVKPRRCLIRAVPGLRVVGAHHNYICPDGRNLWGDEMGNPLRVKDMMIDHRNKHRDPARRQAALDYVDARTGASVEPTLIASRPASPEKIRDLNGKLRRGIRNWTPA